MCCATSSCSPTRILNLCSSTEWKRRESALVGTGSSRARHLVRSKPKQLSAARPGNVSSAGGLPSEAGSGGRSVRPGRGGLRGGSRAASPPPPPLPPTIFNEATRVCVCALRKTVVPVVAAFTLSPVILSLLTNVLFVALKTVYTCDKPKKQSLVRLFFRPPAPKQGEMPRWRVRSQPRCFR